jgi:hypothetical protein
MPSPWQIECLLMRMQSLRTEILRVKYKDRPYAETDILYDALVAVIDSRRIKLEKAIRVYSLSSEPLPYDVFKTVARDLETVFRFFSYADRVDSPRIPFELIRSLSWVANHLFDERCYSVVRLEPEYNYSILSCRREFEKKGWQQYWRESVNKNLQKQSRRALFFTADDISTAARLISALKSRSDLLSRHLLGQISKEAVRLLDECEKPSQPAKALVSVLVDDLNEVLLKGPLYEGERFINVRLSEEAKRQSKLSLRGERLVRLNRMLMDETYPSELPTVLLLGFPSSDAGSTLVHALAAHEFGHEFAHIFRDDLNGVHEFIVTEVKNRYHAKLEDYLAGLVFKLKGENRDDVYEKGRKNVVARLNTIAENWLKEIFSDLVAARLVGPAFLAAFDRIILGHGKASENYPPAYLRRRLVHEYLKRILPKIVEDKVWEQLFSDNHDFSGSDDEIYWVMEHVFETVIPEIDLILQKIASPLMKVDSKKVSSITDKIADCIDHLAPPPPSLFLNPEDRVPDAEEFWLLMFAGWHYRLSGRFLQLVEDQCLDSSAGQAEDILGNLILHTLQSFELNARWNEKYPKRISQNVS